jgi:hypothetical protein
VVLPTGVIDQNQDPFRAWFGFANRSAPVIAHTSPCAELSSPPWPAFALTVARDGSESGQARMAEFISLIGERSPGRNCLTQLPSSRR